MIDLVLLVLISLSVLILGLYAIAIYYGIKEAGYD